MLSQLVSILLPLVSPLLKLLGGLGALLVAKQSGKKDARLDALEKQVEQRKQAATIDKSVRTAPVSDVDKRLHPYYRD